MTSGDPFEDLGDELRRQMAGEFRRTAEEDEYAARKAVLRARSLADVAYELMGRGDTVSVTVGSRHRYRGRLVHARGSLATLETGIGDSIHLNLDGNVTVQVVERNASGGRSRDQSRPESFLAQLREIELEERVVDVVAQSMDEPMAGRIEAVTRDHLMLETADGTWFVPLREVAAVVQRSESAA